MPQSPVSNVFGKASDRSIQIWLENTHYNVSLTIQPSDPCHRRDHRVYTPAFSLALRWVLAYTNTYLNRTWRRADQTQHLPRSSDR
jgi:hypothetical protein